MLQYFYLLFNLILFQSLPIIFNYFPHSLVSLCSIRICLACTVTVPSIIIRTPGTPHTCGTIRSLTLYVQCRTKVAGEGGCRLEGGYGCLTVFVYNSNDSSSTKCFIHGTGYPRNQKNKRVIEARLLVIDEQIPCKEKWIKVTIKEQQTNSISILLLKAFIVYIYNIIF